MRNYKTLNAITGLTACLLIFIFGCNLEKSKQNTPDKANKTIVWLKLSANLINPEPANFVLNDQMELAYQPVITTDRDSNWQSVYAMTSMGNAKWTFYPSEPVRIKYGFGTLLIVNPGDSIEIEYNGEEYKYFGKGTEKLNCWNQMKTIVKGRTKPTLSNNLIRSFNDYLNWKQFLDNKLALQMPILESYKDRISFFEYEYFKTIAVSGVESDRIQTFEALRTYCQNDPKSGITSTDLNVIWDSTLYNPLNSWLQTKEDYFTDIFSIAEFNKMEVWRKFGFDGNSDSLKSKELRNYMYYSRAKQNYKGLLRERVLAKIMEDQTKKRFNDPITQMMLNDYYSQPGYPEFKKQIKTLEEKVAEKLAKK